MADITAIILTYNEEKNIEHCINSISNVVKRIVVVDSFSTDRTVEIAKKLGAEVVQNEFINHSKQHIFGIEWSKPKTKWIFKIDADERLTKESACELEKLCNENMNTNINGIIVRFNVNFLGKELKHGGIYPFKKLLVYKNGKGKIEDRNMDEHIVLTEGFSIEMKNDSIHQDFKDLSLWIDKHNKYSSREVLDYKKMIQLNINRKDTTLKSFLKFRVYYKLPMSMRAKLYYYYRYYFKLGFLDGKEGKIFCFLQAYWYRFLVDAKIYESRKEQ